MLNFHDIMGYKTGNATTIIVIVIALIIFGGVGSYFFVWWAPFDTQTGSVQEKSSPDAIGDKDKAEQEVMIKEEPVIENKKELVACNNEICFNPEFKACTIGSSYTQVKTPGGTSLFTVIGAEGGKCRVETKIIKHSFQDFEGMTQRCLLNNSKDFTSAVGELDAQMNRDIKSAPCEGELFETIKSLQQ